ncbi:hypothetical protein J5N97_014871 [Dioscorea zingiberensis]|uniref:Homeobox domain-containing protein n=1 Tax=Dioscorea zingiberensis TaxID=325984 RepID=A0A9D5HKH1_9LILI|nr:hypothetical protein J5N97_014871 [Dioscorea zingiberensis]
MPQTPSTRWCPTPEQLMVLEDMYRSGLKTPNASQIQQITAYLSYYGKIEGKNVFYWFQNHKARDRQKLRRRLSRHQQLLLHNHNPNHQLIHTFQDPSPPLFLQQGGSQDAEQAMNLLGKLEAEGRDGVVGTTSGIACGCDVVHACCRPLITLDLFPSKSTGLRDECSSYKNSSCSTSTNL